MIKVVNKYKHNPTNSDFYIGRGSVLGNPYTSKELNKTKAQYQANDREESIKKYREWINKKIEEKDPEVTTQLNKIYKYITTVKSVNLVCFCSPQKCHGDVLAELILNKIHDKYTVIDITIDIRHFRKKYMHEAEHSKNDILIINTYENKTFKDKNAAVEYIWMNYQFSLKGY